MNCTHPIYALNRGVKEDGKLNIKILPKRPDTYNLRELERIYGSENILSLPCGHCLACKVNYAREWSVRCMLEASLYKDNWFLTLTYDDAHLPVDGKVNKVDVQLFLKRLRQKVPGLRFLCSAEYGEHTKRPHYHLILFNCHLDDVKCISKGRLGGYYFDSKIILNAWSKGQVTLGYVTPSSCEYVARYTLKKINGDEFITMSLRPGIGADYFKRNLDSIYDTDGVYIKGQKYKVPRYCDKILEASKPLFFKHLKNDRRYLLRERYLSKLSDFSGMTDELIYENDNKVLAAKFKDKLKKGVL